MFSCLPTNKVGFLCVTCYSITQHNSNGKLEIKIGKQGTGSFPRMFSEGNLSFLATS